MRPPTFRYNLTLFKLIFGKLVLDIYDKGGRLLRVEEVVNNVAELRCGKEGHGFRLRLARSRAPLRRSVTARDRDYDPFIRKQPYGEAAS